MSEAAMLRGAEAFEPRDTSIARLGADELARWDELASRDAELRSPFFSSTYARSVAAVREGVRACVLRSSGTPVAFLPYQFPTGTHRWLASAEPVGGEMTDAFGLVAEPHARIAPGALLRAAGLASFQFTHLLDSQREHGLAGERSEPGLAIDFPRGGAVFWDELRAERKDYVDKTERRARKLEREQGALVFRYQCDDPLATLAELLRQKREQYQRTGARDVLAEPWKRELLARLATSRAPNCTGVLSTLHAGSTPVAFHFGLRSGPLLQYWFPVYNVELASHSPGRLLIKALLCASSEHDLTRIDRGAGDTQAKRELANVERAYWSGLWQRPGLRAGAFRAWRSLAWRMERRPESRAE